MTGKKLSNRDILREIAVSQFKQDKQFVESEFTNNQKKFVLAIRRTIVLESKIQTLSFNYSERPLFGMCESPKLINADWLLEIGLLHIYLESYLVLQIFRENGLSIGGDPVKNEVIKDFRDKKLAHIEDFEAPSKRGDELILDIAYMAELISECLCKLVNEEEPNNEHRTIVFKSYTGELIYMNSIKQNTHSHLEELYHYFHKNIIF
ncbi:hypothetical protein R2F61_07390 [Mollicutes bacterium LVI A0078]|nr:hypothetical protein R2F61_07390 [Mollicutes bacterium LVI A0078]